MKTGIQTLVLRGERYVVIPEADYERLRSAATSIEMDGPELPRPNADGLFPAVAYARISLARKLVRRRRALGLTQAELARRAGIRPETLCRIEKGDSTPSVASIDRLDRAMAAAEAEAND